MVVVVSFMLRPVYLPGTKPPPPVGPTADVGAVTHRRAPGIEPRSVGLAATSAAHYSDSIGQDRGKLQLRTVPTWCIDVLHKTHISTSDRDRQTDRHRRKGWGGEGKACCTTVSQAMPARPSGKG